LTRALRRHLHVWGSRDTVSRIRRGTRWTVRWAPWSLYDVYLLYRKLFGP